MKNLSSTFAPTKLTLALLVAVSTAASASADDLTGYLSNDFLHFGLFGECGTPFEVEALRGNSTDECNPDVNTATKTGPSVAPDGALGAPFYASEGKWYNLYLLSKSS